MSDNIIENLVVVKLNISYVSGHMTADEVIKDAIQKYSVNGSNISARLRMFPTDTTKPITKLLSQLRQYWYRETLPWDDGNWRVVTATKWKRLMEAVSNYKSNLIKEVDKLCDNYDDLKAQSKKTLGSLYNEKKFPSKDEIKNGLMIKIESGTVASPVDARLLGINDAEKKKIENNMKKRYHEQQKKAFNDLLDKLKVAVNSIMEKTQKDQKGIKYKGIIENICLIANAAKGLNFIKDPKLDKICDDIIKDLTQWRTDTIKESPIIRKSIETNSKNILKQIDEVKL